MLRGKLIALGLLGITTFGAIASNTTISIAAPTKAEEFNDIVQKKIIRGFDKIEEILKEKQYLDAVNLRSEVQDQLTALSKNGGDITNLQRKFNELSKQIDDLKKDEKEIEKMRKNITSITDDIIYSLYMKDYKYISTQFSILSNDIYILSKYEPIDGAVLSKFENLTYRSINREFLKQAEDIVNSIEAQLDNLSNFIKEKNLTESISAKKQLTSDIKKLDDLLKVPEFIKKKFDLCCKKLDKLVELKEVELKEEAID